MTNHNNPQPPALVKPLRRAARTMLLTLLTILTVLTGTLTPAQALVGGSTVAQPDQARWIARIEQNCTASLIAPDIVLTAAHCLRNDGRVAPSTVTVGWRNFNDPDDPRNDYVTRHIAERILHPRYEVGNPQYDVGIARLAQPISDREPVRIGAPGIASDYDGVGEAWIDLTLYGYGRTGPSTGSSPVPRQLDTKLRDHAFMESIWNSPKFFNYSRSRHLGAGGQLGGPEGACTGDSGGPMIGSGADYRTRTRGDHVHDGYTGPILMGVFSSHIGVCAQNPGLYERMDQGEFLDWVIDTVASPLYCGDQIRFGGRPQWTISTTTRLASCTAS